MKRNRFELTRDSRLLWLPVIAAAITYLMASPAPTTWTYHQWLQAAASVVAALSTKQMTSGLRGEHDRLRRTFRSR